MLLILSFLAGCNLREDKTLPSGVSPFDLIDGVSYIKGTGIISTTNPDIFVQVSEEEPEGFSFIEDEYNFFPTSLSYYLKFIDSNGEDVTSVDSLPIVAFPSEQFTQLGLKYAGDYERFYPYPSSDSINGFGAYYQDGYCYFVLNDNGYYQTVVDTTMQTSVSVEIDLTQTNDINLSLFQAQFILPRVLLPPGIQRINLEKIDSEYLAEFVLTLSNLPVSFNLVQNNPDSEIYPILYLPLAPETDMDAITVKQILPNQQEHIFHYDEILDTDDKYSIYGNCLILLVNNQGRFIVDEL